MASPTPTTRDRHAWQSAHGLSALLVLGVACALFVAVAFAIVAPTAEPPVLEPEPGAPARPAQAAEPAPPGA